MKIVFTNEDGSTRCLTQVRDYKYLAVRFNSDAFLAMYNSTRAHGHTDDDFVDVTNEKVKEIILNSPYIVDFTDIAKLDLTTLSRLIVVSARSMSENDRLDFDHKRDDILDIMEFKKGILPYQIPVGFDNKVYMDMGPVYFGSSTIPGYFLLKKKDINVNLMEFLANNHTLLHALLERKDICVGFDSVKVGDQLLFKFITRTKLQQKIEDIKKKF